MSKIDSLTFSCEKIQVLKGVNSKVKQGEISSTVGVDNAGKSALLKCIVGLLKPQGGQISYNSEPLPRPASAVMAKGTALVSEGRWIFPDLAVEENLFMGGCLARSRKEGLEKAYSMLGRLKERHTQRVDTTSGGGQQMLTVARELMSNPKILVLDELFLRLVSLIVNEVTKYAGETNRQRVIILLVEQNARKTLKTAHCACVMEQGKIVCYGTGDEVAYDGSVVTAYSGRKK